MNCFGACNCKELTGWVTERSIVHAWKACVPKGTRGSNPLPSVLLRIKRFAGLLSSGSAHAFATRRLW